MRSRKLREGGGQRKNPRERATQIKTEPEGREEGHREARSEVERRQRHGGGGEGDAPTELERGLGRDQAGQQASVLEVRVGQSPEEQDGKARGG